jgi:Fe-S oxidoreductase
MLTPLEKLLFLLLAAASLYFGGTGFFRVYRAIRRGKPENRFDRLPERVARGLWVVLTQQTVFKKRPLVSFLHALVFYGFVYYLLVNLSDVREGLFPVRAQGGLWNPINLAADLLTAGILVGIVGLMIRRYALRPAEFRFAPKVPRHEKAEAGIPLDSGIVGAFIIFHVGCRLFSKATQLARHGSADPFQPVASAFSGLFAGMSPGAVVGLEHVFWWGAIGSILLFIPYFPRSKHIHLFVAPINIALKKDKPGVLEPIDFDTEESYGAAKLEDFSWPRLMDAYSCIMCNRCQEVCPAYVTGKALSPAAILVNERYELNGILARFAAGEESPRPLMDFALNREAAWACTTCLACIEVCPVGNDQMVHILDVRREQVLMQAEFPGELKTAFRGMERSGNPWALPQEQRLEWAQKLPFEVPTVEKTPEPEVLYWVGCAPSFDPRAQNIARSMARILNAAGLKWAVLGEQEKCTGDAARRAGNEYLFFQMATENIETLNAAGAKTIVTTCPHCFHTLGNEYPQFGGAYVVRHHSEFIGDLIRSGRLRLRAGGDEHSVAFHDPCYLGRHNGLYDEPRGVLRSLGSALTEAPRSREGSFCCGAGGAQFWKEEEPGTEKVSENRYRELKGTGARTVATGCPFCMRMFEDEAAREDEGQGLGIKDIAELVAARLADGQ